jgi:DNA-binding beta-propeller fold protein YncE
MKYTITNFRHGDCAPSITPLIAALLLMTGCAGAPTSSPTGEPARPSPTAAPALAPTATIAPTPAPTLTPTAVAQSLAVPCKTDCLWKITRQPKTLGGNGAMLVDHKGHIVVADMNTYSVLKFDSDGNLLSKWGSYGTEDGQFGLGMSLALDKDDNIYIGDYSNSRVEKFDSNGKFLMKFGTHGRAPGQFINPSGLAVDAQGNIYVADVETDNNGHHISRPITKFDSAGNFQGTWGNPGDKPFSFVLEIKTDSQGAFYVSDYSNYRVLKLDMQGKVQATYDVCGKQRSVDAKLQPSGVALDANGKVYVMDLDSHRICVFASDGKFLSIWGKEGDGEGDFIYPLSADFDSQGNLYIFDGVGSNRSIDGRLRKFSKLPL